MNGRWPNIVTEDRPKQRGGPFWGMDCSLFAAIGALLVLVSLAGCRAAPQPLGLPSKYTIENENLVIQSDVKLTRNHELLKDLDQLHEEILATLDLPMQKQPVVIYLFGDEKRYHEYLHLRYPRLPPRRAYFVGTAKELAVYTFWGDRIQEDIRHEFTHGVLHATLKDVPLWLDEGLAEYFEVANKPVGMNRAHARSVAAAIAGGWKPDLERLETLTTVDQMHNAEYEESWAWVHFMLHHNDESRAVLTGYLRDLRNTSDPGLLSARLRSNVLAVDNRFMSHTAGLYDGVSRVGYVQPKE